MQIIDGISEPALRLGAFAGIFLLLALYELAAPRRSLRAGKLRRWATNLSIVGLGAVTVRALGWIAQPLVAVGAAVIAARNGWGVLNAANLPLWLDVAITVVVMDFAIWVQHYASHRVPLLWRLHRMHHADVDFDVTTALRFHPVEIGLSMLYKVVWVLALGPAAVAVVVFEIALNGCAMFSHANIAMPGWLDRILRTVLVTPDMHRVHHSILEREHHSNFGFNLSIWDRLLGTYTPQPQEGHTGMTIGLPAYQTEAPTGLRWSLALPFRRAQN